MSAVAAKVRTEKEAHPERFCSNSKCLWRVVTARGLNPCQNHPATTLAPVRVNLAQLVREVLDGVAGDIDTPAEYRAARFGEAGPDGLTNTQRPYYCAIVKALVDRGGRALTSVEETSVGLAFIMEWNRRSEAADRAAELELRQDRSEWLAEYTWGD